MVDQEKLARLRKLITEGLRVQLGNDAITYINVGHAMEDVSARQNHTIFARRGCGKPLLLHDSAKALPSDVRAIYLNCEDFKQHTFPNVLIEILSSLFGEIDSHLSGWFGRKVKTKEIVKAIRNRLAQMHRSPDVQDEAIKQTVAAEMGAGGELGLTAENVKLSISGSKKTKEETERSFRNHREKLQELDLWLPELKKSLREFFAVSAHVKCIIHQAGSALTHKSQPGNYQAFAIDIGCYAHFRKMEGRFNEIDVSMASARDQMRSAPVLNSADLQTLFKTVPKDAEAALKASALEDAA
jgi:hypothetical protein